MVSPDHAALVVFLRHNNDIDHIVPVLHRWGISREEAVRVVITTRPRYLHDPRVRLVDRFESIHVDHIDRFLPAGLRKHRERLRNIRSKPPNHPAHLGLRALDKLPFDSITDPGLPVDENGLAKSILDWCLGEPPGGLAVFDWVYDGFGRTLAEVAGKQGRTTVSLPHGDRPFANWMVTNDDLVPGQVGSEQYASLFDHTVSPNDHEAERTRPHLPADRLHILGSPRFNRSWMDLLDGITPRFEPSSEAGDLCVSLFLRNTNYPIFWQELARTVQMLTGLPDLHLIVKPHPRGGNVFDRQMRPQAGYDPGAVENLEVAGAEVPSQAIIRASDVVLDLATSVVFDAIQRNTPVLELEYLHANRSIVSEKIPVTAVNCRDQLCDQLSSLRKDGSTGFYPPGTRDAFLKQMITPNGEDPLGAYVALLARLLDQSPSAGAKA